MKRLILFITIFALVFASFAAVNTSAKAASGMTATVLASQLNVRSQPRISGGWLTAVNWGDRLVVLGRNDRANWFLVVTPDGTIGWVSAFWVRMSRNVSRSSLPITTNS